MWWGAYRPRRWQADREDVCDRGHVTFNYLQQHEPGFDDPPLIRACEVPQTTDWWGIVDEDES